MRCTPGCSTDSLFDLHPVKACACQELINTLEIRGQLHVQGDGLTLDQNRRTVQPSLNCEMTVNIMPMEAPSSTESIAAEADPKDPAVSGATPEEGSDITSEMAPKVGFWHQHPGSTILTSCCLHPSI